MVRFVAAFLCLTIAFSVSVSLRAEAPLLFLSTQFTPLHEAAAMRDIILAGFPRDVDFQPYDNEVFMDLVLGQTVDPTTPDLIGGLHGDFVALRREDRLASVDNVFAALEGRQFVESFVQLGRLGEEEIYFVPWMQATYLMVANRRALAYLPEGVDLNRLSYAELAAWGANLLENVGAPMLGFPVGTKGLMHRFLQGYLYPSYTGTMVGGFRSLQAEEMWEEFRQLWQYVSPRSLTFTRMDQPLLSDEVWVAWDHTARLIEALRERPDDFVAFPAPAGPMGRGFYAVLAGLGLVKDASNPAASVELIEYLTRPDVQLLMLESIGFFPVVETEESAQLDPGLAQLKQAVLVQASSEDAIPSLLPLGLGERSSDFNLVYMTAFSQIVLRGNVVRDVLEAQAVTLQEILEEAEAPCWPPDAPSEGPCPVE